MRHSNAFEAPVRQTCHCPTQTPTQCHVGGASNPPMHKTECSQTTAWYCPALCAFRTYQNALAVPCPLADLPVSRFCRRRRFSTRGRAEDATSPHPTPHLLLSLRENSNAHARRRRLHWSPVTCSHAARAGLRCVLRPRVGARSAAPAELQPAHAHCRRRQRQPGRPALPCRRRPERDAPVPVPCVPRECRPQRPAAVAAVAASPGLPP